MFVRICTIPLVQLTNAHAPTDWPTNRPIRRHRLLVIKWTNWIRFRFYRVKFFYLLVACLLVCFSLSLCFISYLSFSHETNLISIRTAPPYQLVMIRISVSVIVFIVIVICIFSSLLVSSLLFLFFTLNLSAIGQLIYGTILFSLKWGQVFLRQIYWQWLSSFEFLFLLAFSRSR